MRFYRSVLNMLYNSHLPYILKDEGCFWKSFGVGILSRDYPIFQGVPFHVEVDADFHHGQAAQDEAFGIVLQVNLLHGGCGRLVQFQLHDVERGGRAHH